MLLPMTKPDEIHPDVLAHMHRIHHAVNDGTVDKAAVNEALAKLWELLSPPRDPMEEAGQPPDEEAPEPEEEAHATHGKARARKKR